MNERWNLSRFIIALERCLHALVLPKWMQFADEALATVSQHARGFIENESETGNMFEDKVTSD